MLQFREDDPFLFGIKIFCSLVILFYLLVTAVFVIIDSVATVTFRLLTIFLILDQSSRVSNDITRISNK